MTGEDQMKHINNSDDSDNDGGENSC